MIIGPKVHFMKIFIFNIDFPKNYPYSPPVHYVPRNNIRIHPIIWDHKSGFSKVCLSILEHGRSGWTTIMDISTVLLSIQSLLDSDPLLNEPGFYRKNKHQLNIINDYNDVIFFENISSLLMKNYYNIPENF